MEQSIETNTEGSTVRGMYHLWPGTGLRACFRVQGKTRTVWGKSSGRLDQVPDLRLQASPNVEKVLLSGGSSGNHLNTLESGGHSHFRPLVPRPLLEDPANLLRSLLGSYIRCIN